MYKKKKNIKILWNINRILILIRLYYMMSQLNYSYYFIACRYLFCLIRIEKLIENIDIKDFMAWHFYISLSNNRTYHSLDFSLALVLR